MYIQCCLGGNQPGGNPLVGFHHYAICRWKPTGGFSPFYAVGGNPPMGFHHYGIGGNPPVGFDMVGFHLDNIESPCGIHHRKCLIFT